MPVKTYDQGYPAGKGFEPRCRAGFTILGPALGLMFCCHLEILSTSGRRGPQVFILPIMEPVLPTSDFPQSCHSYLLTSRCHIARSRVVSQFILTMFSVGLKSWGEYEDLTTRQNGPNAYSFVWSPCEKSGTMYHSLLYSQSLVCISCSVNSCEMRPVNRRLLCLWNQTYFSDNFQESRSSMRWCQPSRLLESPFRGWRCRSLSSHCPKSACQHPVADYCLSGSGELRDKYLKPCGPGFQGASYWGRCRGQPRGSWG